MDGEAMPGTSASSLVFEAVHRKALWDRPWVLRSISGEKQPEIEFRPAPTRGTAGVTLFPFSRIKE
jgi:hypothetical protein